MRLRLWLASLLPCLACAETVVPRAPLEAPSTPVQRASEPPAYRSPDGRYRVRFRGIPKRTVRQLASENGEHTTIMTTLSHRSGLQSVLSSTLTGVGRRFCDADQGEVGAEALQKMQCHVVSAAPHPVRQLPGTKKEFICDDGQRGVLLGLCDGSRIASAKEARTYLVFALYSAPEAARIAHEFVESFELLP